MIEQLYTSQTPKTADQKTASEAGAAQGTVTSLSFLDFMLTRLAEGQESETDSNSTLLTSDNPTLDKNPSLDPIELLATNDEVAETASKISTEETALDDVLALNQQAFDKLLTGKELSEEEALKVYQGLALKKAEAAEENAQALQNLHDVLSAIEELIENGQSELVATNLTPAQITDLKVQVENILNGDSAGEDTLNNFAGIFAGSVSLNAPRVSSANNDSATSHLNVLIGNPERPDDILPPVDDFAENFERNFRDLIRDINAQNEQATNGTARAEGSAAGTNTAATIASGTSTLQGWPFSLSGSLFVPLTDGLAFSDSALEQYGLGTPLQVTSTSGLTNVATQAQSAAHPHPAMQTVAASISRAATGGETQNITLRLNPEELGRVEVKMKFAADKSLKATVIAEKPETFLMMQRDAQVLERALQDAGLEAGVDLSFELADDGSQFTHDGSHDGQGSHGNGDANGEDDLEIIETTMMWQVDPETGHTRYNIFA